ncbi:helix-turn-helix domain-containing protein [Actinoallomurus rhizosphaericola]|uniref:helix-turn-helix transcriptional regulator n=1 Tax=Actinoallomurus rhizosphaericola TaxID=2952536 RepID=UPI0020902FD9|nr:helix-turn-helix transcriptional regulator [Actinoallomurus rhizosphaericola]MCO5994119.1 helix-turn-helix domain-containing protein [Actinoallomurus rhizosphaericola]
MTRPDPLGTWLLRRARDHGMTSEQLADLLGLPVHRIRRLASGADLDDLPLRAVRALARRLDLPWPGWLDQTPQAEPAANSADSLDDADRVHAVLVLALAHPVRVDQIAHVLHWPLERAQTAAGHLAALLHEHPVLRLTADEGNVLQLAVQPDLLLPDIRTRLQQVLNQQQGPATGMAFIAYRAGHRDHQRIKDILTSNPELLDAAVAASYITCHIDAHGQPTQIKLTPEVAFSLNIPVNLHDTLLLDPKTE